MTERVRKPSWAFFFFKGTSPISEGQECLSLWSNPLPEALLPVTINKHSFNIWMVRGGQRYKNIQTLSLHLIIYYYFLLETMSLTSVSQNLMLLIILSDHSLSSLIYFWALLLLLPLKCWLSLRLCLRPHLGWSYPLYMLSSSKSTLLPSHVLQTKYVQNCSAFFSRPLYYKWYHCYVNHPTQKPGSDSWLLHVTPQISHSPSLANFSS